MAPPLHRGALMILSRILSSIAPGPTAITRRLAPHSLEGRVVVVTGASSGLGRAAAIEFARRGCVVALAARREPDLEETARLCRKAGGRALVVVTDITQEAQIARLVETTRDELGPIDVWVNNAGVTMFGLLGEAPLEAHRRVIEINLLGAMACARAVLPEFRARGTGTLINVGSVLSAVGQPYVPSYVISKFGLRGLSEALRAEVAEAPGIHVCTLLAYAMNTPHFQSGANHVGLRAHAMPPAQSPERVAHAIVDLAQHPRREVVVPRIAELGIALHAIFPEVTERLLLRTLRRWHFDGVPEPTTEGNLYRPIEVGDGAIRGERPPRLGMPRLLLWIAGELGKMAAQSIASPLGSRDREPRQATTPRG